MIEETDVLHSLSSLKMKIFVTNLYLEKIKIFEKNDKEVRRISSFLILEPVWTIGVGAEREHVAGDHLPVVAVDVGLAEQHLYPHLCSLPDWHLSCLIGRKSTLVVPGKMSVLSGITCNCN